jgi:hypothetical protein
MDFYDYLVDYFVEHFSMYPVYMGAAKYALDGRVMSDIMRKLA